MSGHAGPGRYRLPPKEAREQAVGAVDQNKRLEVWLARRREHARTSSPAPWRVVATLRGPMLMDANNQVVRFNRQTCDMVAAAVNFAMSQPEQNGDESLTLAPGEV